MMVSLFSRVAESVKKFSRDLVKRQSAKLRDEIVVASVAGHDDMFGREVRVRVLAEEPGRLPAEIPIGSLEAATRVADDNPRVAAIRVFQKCDLLHFFHHGIS